MNIKLIIAVDKNGVMGIDNKLPWKLSDDLIHFKNVTSNSPLIMGSKTYDSLPGILPNREHIVLSKTMEGDENKSVFTSIYEAIDYCIESEYEDVYVIGGANIIKQFNYLKLLDELIITHVNCEVEGDTKIDLDKDLNIYRYSISDVKEYIKDDKNEYNFKTIHYIIKPERFYQ